MITEATMLAMTAGADFVKTSTGERGGASIEAARIMVKVARDYAERTGSRVGLKFSGGIRTADHALEYVDLVRNELGDDWLTPGLFRIGASALLDDVLMRLTS
jgi:deoxyribose-phosphate aldolase